MRGSGGSVLGSFLGGFSGEGGGRDFNTGSSSFLNIGSSSGSSGFFSGVIFWSGLSGISLGVLFKTGSSGSGVISIGSSFGLSSTIISGSGFLEDLVIYSSYLEKRGSSLLGIFLVRFSLHVLISQIWSSLSWLQNPY